MRDGPSIRREGGMDMRPSTYLLHIALSSMHYYYYYNYYHHITFLNVLNQSFQSRNLIGDSTYH